MRNGIVFVIIAGIWVFFAGCTRLFEPAVIEDLLYGQYVRDGWEAFAQKNYEYAADRFSRALALDSTRGDAYAGFGWVYLMTGNYSAADYNFARCALRPDSNYYGYAGWAFLMSAWDSFQASNAYLDSVLTHRPNWVFPFYPRLLTRHLWGLKAHNYFLLSQFSASLQAVQAVEPQFYTDVQTPEGLTELAQKIQELLEGVETAVPGLPRPELTRFSASE